MSNVEICAFDCVRLEDRSQGNITFKNWKIPGAVPPTSTQDNPVFCFPGAGGYGASLIVGNEFGTDTTFFTIQVKSGPLLSTDSVVYSCRGEPIRLRVTGADEYLWSPPELFDDPTSNTPTVFAEQTRLLTVIGSDGSDCNDTTTVRMW